MLPSFRVKRITARFDLRRRVKDMLRHREKIFDCIVCPHQHASNSIGFLPGAEGNPLSSLLSEAFRLQREFDGDIQYLEKYLAGNIIGKIADNAELTGKKRRKDPFGGNLLLSVSGRIMRVKIFDHSRSISTAVKSTEDFGVKTGENTHAGLTSTTGKASLRWQALHIRRAISRSVRKCCPKYFGSYLLCHIADDGRRA